MFNLFKSKQIKEEKEEKTEKFVPSSLKTVTFNASDDCFQRASKILVFAGICGQIGDIRGYIAEAIQIYMKLDKQKQEFESNQNKE